MHFHSEVDKIDQDDLLHNEKEREEGTARCYNLMWGEYLKQGNLNAATAIGQTWQRAEVRDLRPVEQNGTQQAEESKHSSLTI